MNYKMVLYTVGKAIFIEGLFLLLPLLVAFSYSEPTKGFYITALCALVLGFLLTRIDTQDFQKLNAKDGFLIVTLSWIVLSLVGAFPFYIDGCIPSYTDALFESVNGFTTTGASVIQDVTVLANSMILWRSLSQWLGGMGVLLFVLAVADRNPNRSINIMKAEMPGAKVDKIKPKAKSSASMLYKIYIVLTLLEALLLFVGGMPLFDSVVHSLGTAGTGGFSMHNDSVMSFSPFIQIVLAVFMMLFAINFSIIYLGINRKWKSIMESSELKWFLGIIVTATLVIVIANQPLYASFAENIRLSFFQVTSIISTTGYCAADFGNWSGISKVVLFMLMIIGGCEGSTAGGFKVSRVMIMSHSIKKEIKHALHPRIVTTIRIGNKPLSNDLLAAVSSYLALYILTAATALLLISNEPMGLENNLTAVISCLNNVGIGLNGMGISSNFAAYSDFSKVILSITMLLGRLEIYPVLLCLSRRTAY